MVEKSWSESFKVLMNATNHQDVVLIVERAVRRALIDYRETRKHIETATAARHAFDQVKCCYSLLMNTLWSLKSSTFPELRVEYVKLCSGMPRLLAPLPPSSGQFELFDELFWPILQLSKPNALMMAVSPEVPGDKALQQHAMFSEAEQLLMRFKPLADPLNPELTEEDLAIFWQDR